MPVVRSRRYCGVTTQFPGARSETEMAIEEAAGFVPHGEQQLAGQSLFRHRKRIRSVAGYRSEWVDLGSSHVQGQLACECRSKRKGFTSLKI